MTERRRFYERQVQYLAAGDADGLIENHYDEDAVFVTYDAAVRGRDALRAYFSEYIRRLGSFELVSTDKFTETDDTILFEATVRSNLGEARVYNAMVLPAGKITYHFSSVIDR